VTRALAILWRRLLSRLGLVRSTGAIEVDGQRVILREIHRARRFPQEPVGQGPVHIAACKVCGGPLHEVVFTTAGAGHQAAVWRQYPLAVDGWRCRTCGWCVIPRRLRAEEVTAFERTSARAFETVQLDEAEFWLRRILGSWPGYLPAYVNLGRIAYKRSLATRNFEERSRHRAEAEAWLRRAEGADPEVRIPELRVTLAEVLGLNGKEDDANGVVAGLLAREDLPGLIRSQAESVATQLAEGRALFTRATELAADVVLEPPSKPLARRHRKALEAARALLVVARERNESFATLWYLGKVEARLGGGAQALAAFQRAHTVEPDQPDGCRELCAAYLALDRVGEALPIARRAHALQPEDAGLQCNLALVLLLTGDMEGARAEVTGALRQDPSDAITAGLSRFIDDVQAGRRRQPRTLAEVEGRR
jgi:tetratricopeptide (TPR) repeat protein